jgi:HAD superfamily hydrolase (TIGR01450 family)
MPDALAAAYDVLLLDLDGVVYLGPKPIPGAPDALRRAKQAGVHLAYVTNNASRTPAAVAAVLADMGAPAAPEDVITSCHAAARLLADQLPPKSRVLVIGSTALRLAVRERGLVPVSSAADSPQAVVQGYGPGIDYPSLAEGGLAVRAGAIFVATNADSTLPTPRGIQPGNGSLLRVIAHATGIEPVVAGKPEPPLHRESVIRTGARHPLVVGDRLDTDIEAAYNTGTDSFLVLTGVDGPLAVVLAPPHRRPTYVAATLDALLEPYPEVTVTAPGTPGAPGTGAPATGAPATAGGPDAAADVTSTCGGWTAAPISTGELTLTGEGAPINGLRALAAAAWASQDKNGTLTAAQVARALDRLAAAGLPHR